METDVALLAALVIAYGTVSRLIDRSVLTGPMLFTAAGLVIGAGGLGWLELDLEGEAVSVLAELTLVLVLFTDAARIDLPRLRRQAQLPVRMLASLPLIILLGTLAAVWLYDGVGWVEAALVAAVLAPTDAALGQAVVSDERVPLRIRQTLNVESGLNDGIVLPAVTILLGLTEAEMIGEPTGEAVAFVARQIGGGLAVGLAVGLGGAWLIDRASVRGWMTPAFQQLATLSCAVAAYVVADVLGGNGFIAAFVGGMSFGLLAREHCSGVYDFAEEEGTLLTLTVFAVLGASLVPDLLAPLDLATAVYVVLSLTVVRMLPIALSLLGTGLRVESVAFLGWFGPRGLASILFALLVVEELGTGAGSRIASVALWTVLASIVAHGMSAVPLVGAYSARLKGIPAHEPEMQAATAFPTRVARR